MPSSVKYFLNLWLLWQSCHVIMVWRIEAGMKKAFKAFGSATDISHGRGPTFRVESGSLQSPVSCRNDGRENRYIYIAACL